MQAPSVLIVEDHDDSSEFFASVARSEGHRVQTASDGVQALRIVDKSWPDFILLDLALPGMDGWEVARKIRTLEHERSRPVIIGVTALSQKDCDNAIAAGCDDCLRKPVDPEILRSVFRWFKLWAPKVPPSSILTGNDPATG